MLEDCFAGIAMFMSIGLDKEQGGMDQLGELLRALKTEPVPLMTLEAEHKRLS